MPVGALPDRVTWLGHATALIEIDGVRVLTDPILRNRVGPLRRHGPPPPSRLVDDLDFLLISHLHHDHADLPSLRRVRRDIRVLGSPGAARFLARHGFANVTELVPGERVAVGSLEVVGVKADHPSRRSVERHSTAIGFLLEGSRSIYFAGDTDLFDEMSMLGPALDLALLPVWGWGPSVGRGHLDPERAARAAALISPRMAVPIHWGTLYPFGLSRLRPGPLRSPAERFAYWTRRLAPHVDVRVLAPGEAISFA
jgi:L-ascorbate metabolism protein UlaG (beta-lactamase superfamily)